MQALGGWHGPRQQRGSPGLSAWPVIQLLMFRDACARHCQWKGSCHFCVCLCASSDYLRRVARSECVKVPGKSKQAELSLDPVPDFSSPPDASGAHTDEGRSAKTSRLHCGALPWGLAADSAFHCQESSLHIECKGECIMRWKKSCFSIWGPGYGTKLAFMFSFIFYK